jgi:hypothetical protein
MPSDRALQWLFPITIVVAVGVGAVIGGSFARTTPERTAPFDATANDSKALVEAVDALRAEIALLREKLETVPSAPGSPGRIETRSDALAVGSELRDATAKLQEAITQLHSSASQVGADTVPLVRPAFLDPHAIEEVSQQTFGANYKIYALWTYQQVMDRFGLPDMVLPRETEVQWIYHAKPHDVEFDFGQGRVVAVQTGKN